MAGASVEMPDKKPLASGSMESTPSPDSNTQTRGAEDTIVQIGDVLGVSVAEDPSFNGYYEVRRGGFIILPAVGRIEAVDLPLKKVQTNVASALEETQLPHATVKVNELRESHNGY